LSCRKKNVELIKKLPTVRKVHVSTAELENIFVEVFHSTEVVRKIRDRLTKYIKESKTDTAELNEPIEYCIDTDYQKLSEHLMKQFNTILN